MGHTRLLSIVCGIMLAIVVMTGCVMMPDGTTGPDYAGIELGSVVAMTVIINEVKSSQDMKDLTYRRLAVLHETLSCPDTGRVDCLPINMRVLPELLANALPVEYQALAPAMLAYIESRAMLYYDLKIPQSENTEMVRKVTVVVMGGALQALAPHISK